MKKYMITKEMARDSYTYYYVYHRKWYWPFWIWIRLFNSLGEAEDYIKQHKAGFVVEYL